MLRRVTSLFVLSGALALPAGLGTTAAVLVLQRVHGGGTAQAASVPHSPPRPSISTAAGSHRGARTPRLLRITLMAERVASSPSVKRPAYSRAAGPTIVAITASPTRLIPPDVVTIAVTLSDPGVTTGPLVAALQLLPSDGSPARVSVQGGFMLHHGQSLALYWEWRTGTSLPPAVYTVRVVVSDEAHPDRTVARGLARTLLTVVRR